MFLTDLAGIPTLFVMAAEAEYGPALQHRLTPLMTGVGPIEAALAMGMTLARLQTEGRLPKLVVSLGSAGSRVLAQAQVYQVSAVEYRDMDASALGFARGETPLSGLPVRIELSLQIPGIPHASIATGGSIVSGRAYDAISTDMVDMETFAVLRACQHFGLPLIGLRGISDGKQELKHVDDWKEYLHVVDRKLALTVDSLFEALEDGVFWF